MGVFSGMISVRYSSPEPSSELLPTVCEELSPEQYEMILAQPHSCQEYLYLEDHVKGSQMNHSSMQDIESEIVIEKLDALDHTLDKLYLTQ